MDRDIAELFLVSFVNRILELKAPKDGIKYEDTSVKKEIINDSQMKASVLEINKEKQKELPEFKKELIVPKPIKVQQQIPKPTVAKIEDKSKKPRISYSIQSQLSATEKLNSLIRDPYVNEIECLGVENPLMVRKSGQVQKTQIVLSIEEIYELIAEFSQKTRIPIINGRIKAALNDLIITAVMTENLGPRFIIQKRKAELVI